MVELLTDEERHRKMAEAARRTAVERFASTRLFRNTRNIMKRSWRMVGKLIAFAVVGAALYGQEFEAVIDNERVTVWDVTWTKGISESRARPRSRCCGDAA